MRGNMHHHHKKAGENLAVVFFLNLAFNVIVVIGALATNSMAILSDFIHDMSDTISIALAWFLERVSQKDSTDKYSYGYQRFSILGAADSRADSADTHTKTCTESLTKNS